MHLEEFERMDLLGGRFIVINKQPRDVNRLDFDDFGTLAATVNMSVGRAA
ncbi:MULTISPECIES: DUF269 domain-containing protein [Bradyrhizobium]|uniref:Uncharacterized protein n=2 Tax=Bradyrhizobium TaxID=374 RepID=A0A9X1RLX2_9BRAD|nr:MULTISPECIES: hypothetical protein [Bradyrhizobium]MCG2632635.1 hypothetical protein [Bradyrhizobium zhengyangense]MCG2645396.1 hypothetical protein [Bradyrhizobium zhengyangense]MCG2672868.1 hypothetical protein [Bradyrhizobium zhengyangense]MDN4985680.1 hypothetical protein [Bradyrhizobium sp. WYCCWR 13022]MDT4740881.1 hypothetical protein [Bradyrhizobium sp. WYCCWR 12699]